MNSLTISEGGSNTFTIRLNTQPSGGGIVTVVLSSTNTDLSFSPTFQLFGGSHTAWNSATIITVSAAEDKDINDETTTITIEANGTGGAGEYDGLSATISVTIEDNDQSLTAGSITQTGATLTLGNGPNTWYSRMTSPSTGACTSQTGTTATLTSLTAGTAYTWKAYSNNTCTNANELASVDFTTEAPTVLPTITISGGAAVTEGTGAVFTVERTGATTSSLTVLLSVSEDTAGGRDFVASTAVGNKQVVIPSNSSTQTYTVATTPDTTDEPNGAVTVAVRNSSDYTHSSASATRMVTDNDATSVTLARSGSSIIHEENSTTKMITVTLGRQLYSGETMTVPLTVSGSNITATDYSLDLSNGSNLNNGVALVTTTPHSVSQPAVTFTGDNTDTVRIATLALTAEDDNEDEGTSETLTIGFGSGGRALTTSGMGTGGTTTTGTAVVTINDNDDPPLPDTPAITISGGNTVDEGNDVVFTLTATPVPSADLTVNYTVSSSGDFFASDPDGAESVTLPTSGMATITITTQDDEVDEPNGSVSINVDSGSGYTVGSPSSASVAVNDNDNPPRPSTPVVGISAGSFVSDGSHVTFIVSRKGLTTSPLTVQLSVSEPSGQDLVPAGEEGEQSVTIPADQRSTTYRVQITGEIDEDTASEITVEILDSSGVYSVDTANDEATVSLNDNREEATRDSLVRFGRTIGIEAVATIQDRLSSSRLPGLTGQLAGQTLKTDHTITDPTGTNPLNEDAPIPLSALHTGTSFAYVNTEETSTGTIMSYWGKGTRSSFESQTIADGKITTLSFGTDWQKGRETYGVMISRSSGDIDYKEGNTTRSLETELTAVIPYGGMELSNEMLIWGAFGLGQGSLTLKPLEDGGSRRETDLDWQMVASGIRGDLSLIDLLPGADLDWHADALWTRTSSEEREGVPSTRSKSTRLRVGVEMSWVYELTARGVVHPHVGLDLIHDGGDAETGLGVDVRGGLDWVDRERGLTLGLSGNKVIHHVDDGYKSWGLSLHVSYDPNPESKEGFSASLSHAVEREGSSGVGSLVGVSSEGGVDDTLMMERSWEMEAAYGVAGEEGMVGSSYTRVSGSDDPEAVRVGYRMEPDRESAEDLTVDTWASSPLVDGVKNNEAGVDLLWRW